MKHRSYNFASALGLLATLGAASAGAGLVACTARIDDAMDAEAGSTSAHGGGGGAGTGGSIDVTSSDTHSTPGDYSDLCALSDGSCIPGAASTNCVTSGTGGGGTSCRLVLDDRRAIAPECDFPGESDFNEACTSAASCDAGLGCVAVGPPDADTAACRNYCCGDVEDCPDNTYCAPQPMFEAPDREIPVCLPVTSCTLLDDTTCPPGLTCAIVRAKGTTSCVEPGPGEDGDACQAGLCAPGFVCLKLLNECRALCHVDGQDCPGGVCIGGSGEFPAGFGICASGDSY